MAGVDWGPGLIVLALGLALGGLLVWRVRTSGRKPALAVEAPLEVRDLEGKRDTLLQQLRELEDTASKRTAEQLARERYAVEVEAARVLLALDERGATAGAKVGRQAAARKAEAAVEARKARPALRGFLWGASSAAAVGLLLFFVARGARPRGKGGALTGNAPGAAADDEVARYKAAIERNPDDFDARLELAQAYLGRHDLMGVWNETQYVLTRSPGHPRALSYQALVRLAMGQGDVAISMLKQALASAPDLLDAYLHLSLVYVRMGRVRDAEATMAEAERRFPDQAPMLKKLMAEMRAQAAAQPATGPPAGDPHAAVPAPPGSAPVAGSGHGVAGLIDLDSALAGQIAPGSLVFVTVRAAGVGAGPPVAVKRLPARAFPLAFEIGAADSMMGQELPERLRIEARVDSDGDPLTRSPSDPSARADGVKAGTSDLRLVLRR